MTLGDLKDYVEKAIKLEDIDEGIILTWADMINEDDVFYGKAEYPPGTIMFGTEKVEDGNIIEGVLYFTPQKVSKLIN